MDPDRGLVAAAAAGDRDAFEDLVRRHQRPIVNLARALTGGSDDAEDLAQEAFVRAWRGLASFRGESQFSTWLHRIAVNVVQTHRSRGNRLRSLFGTPRPAAGQAEDEKDSLEAAPDALDLERDILRRDAIDKALAALPEDLRLAVILRDVQGLEYGAIAEITGAPIGTVESRIFRARQKLKPLLEAVRRG